MMKNIKQFEIYEVNLEPIRGSEQGGFRPCLILQTNLGNNTARTFLAAPLTTRKLEKIYPHQVLLRPSRENGLKSNSKVKLDQLRVIDRSRLGKCMGQLEAEYVPPLFQAIDVMIDRFGDFR